MRTLPVPDPETPDVRTLLAELGAGDSSAAQRLFPVVYDELKRIARIQRHTWRDRAHFLAVAATAMRSVLVDHARRRARAKRGRGRPTVQLEDVDALMSAAPAVPTGEEETLLALDTALARLSALSTRQGRIVECRFFAGMSVEETAEALGISAASVKRGWAVARAWLYRELSAG